MHRKALVEILNNRFVAIVEEMGFTILRTGHTVFIKETGDFGTALISPNGEVFASPLRIGMIRTVGMPTKEALSRMDTVQEGDIWIANDPVSTGGMVTHLPDLFLWKPIIVNGELVCYVMCFIHVTDIGGRVPGSIGPLSSEIYEEGLRLPPSRLYLNGKLNRELLNIILTNCRIPEQNWGDLQAAVSALYRGEHRVHELVEHFGLEVIRQGIIDVLDYAEQRARKLFETIPDGEYGFSDYLEAGSVYGRPLLIRVQMRVEGSSIELNFRGTDPQAPTAFNLPTQGSPHHCFLVQALVIFLRTLDHDIPYNSGLVRSVICSAPPGTLLNPDPGAAVGIRAITMHRVSDVVMGCLAQACPDVVPAGGSGGGTIVLLSADTPNGRKVSVVEPVTGASGGRPDFDGVNGCDIIGSTGRNIPIEVLEDDMPVFVNKYCLRPSSAGAGRQRGGLGIAFSFRLLAPKGRVTARGMERRRFRPWALNGGLPGARAEVKVLTREGEVRDEPRLDVVEMEQGDVISFLAPGGAGWGDPLERDPRAVLEDVKDGYILPKSAEREYGVVISRDGVAQRATRQLRSAMAEQRGPVERQFDFGAERNEYEQSWPSDVVSEVNESLDDIPGSLRSLMHERILLLWESSVKANQHLSIQDIVSRVLPE